MYISPDGATVTDFGEWDIGGSSTAQVKDDRVCFKQTTTEFCPMIFRNPGGTRAKENEYILFRRLGGPLFAGRLNVTWISTLGRIIFADNEVHCRLVPGHRAVTILIFRRGPCQLARVCCVPSVGYFPAAEDRAVSGIPTHSVAIW